MPTPEAPARRVGERGRLAPRSGFPGRPARKTSPTIPNRAVAGTATARFGISVLLGGQLQHILREEQSLVNVRRDVFGQFPADFRAHQDADRRIVPFRHHALAVVFHVDAELHGVRTVEFLRLQLDEDVAFQDAVVEDEVDALVGVVDQDLLLPSLKTEAGAHFEDEILQVVADPLFQVVLLPTRRQPRAEEFQHVVRLDEIVGIELLDLALHHRGILARIPAPAAALVVLAFDLALQLLHAPGSPYRLERVERAHQSVVHRNQLEHVRIGCPVEQRPGRYFDASVAVLDQKAVFGSGNRRFPDRRKRFRDPGPLRRRQLGNRRFPIPETCPEIGGNRQGKPRKGQIKAPVLLEAFGGDRLVGNPFGKPLEQPFAVFRPVFAVLFVFDNVEPGDPRTRRHASVDDGERILPERVGSRPDASDQRIEVLFHPSISLSERIAAAADASSDSISPQIFSAGSSSAYL